MGIACSLGDVNGGALTGSTCARQFGGRNRTVGEFGPVPMSGRLTIVR